VFLPIAEWFPAFLLTIAVETPIVVAGRVLVAGGNGPFQRMNEGGYDTPMTAEVVAYDAVANAWPTLAPLPEARQDGQALSLSDGSVLVFGGVHRTADEVTGLMTAVRFLPGD
jgi:hypothetical protein